MAVCGFVYVLTARVGVGMAGESVFTLEVLLWFPKQMAVKKYNSLNFVSIRPLSDDKTPTKSIAYVSHAPPGESGRCAFGLAEVYGQALLRVGGCC